jgi:hypothetical protein
LVAKKDFNAPKHEELDVPNLQVIKALQSLTSRGYVKTQFSWQWYYYVLTLEGVEYLRNWSESLLSQPLSFSEALTSGLTCPPRLSLQRIKKPSALLVLLLFALAEEKAPTGHLVANARDTVGRKKVLQVNIGLNLQEVSAEAGHETKRGTTLHFYHDQVEFDISILCIHAHAYLHFCAKHKVYPNVSTMFSITRFSLRRVPILPSTI